MAQIDKNTVAASNQLSKFVFVERAEQEQLKILFVGNSITLHGVKPDIGWHHAWGMAASAQEKDYVHVVMEALRQRGIRASHGICQVAEWERQYENGSAVLPLYEKARDFDADILVMRCIENCPGKDFDPQKFQEQYEKLIAYLDPAGRARVILTTGFWKHPGDDAIMAVGRERGYDCLYLGDLGEREEAKAIGLYEHTGVANHPGDLGMQLIAERILQHI